MVSATSTEVLTGNEAQLSCSATDLPAAGSFSWKATGSDTVLSGETEFEQGVQINFLTVSNPTTDTDYTCTVTVDSGTVNNVPYGSFSADVSATLGVFGKYLLKSRILIGLNSDQSLF